MQKLFSTAILCFLVLTLSYAGGPWPQPKGGLYLKLSEWWTVFDQHYTDIGKIDPNVTTGIFNTNLYAEYGLTDRVTVITNANLFSRNLMNNVISGTTNEVLIPGEALNSIGDIDLGIKYGLTKPGSVFPVAVSAIFGIPTGTTGGGSQENIQTGDGEFNQMVRIDAGRGFRIGTLDAYASGYTAINNRTNNFSEEFHLGLELGVAFLNRKLWMTSRLNVVESFKNGLESGLANATSIFANNTEYSSFGLEANYYITKKIGFSAGFAGAFRGEVIAARPSYSVGVFLDLK